MMFSFSKIKREKSMFKKSKQIKKYTVTTVKWKNSIAGI